MTAASPIRAVMVLMAGIASAVSLQIFPGGTKAIAASPALFGSSAASQPPDPGSTSEELKDRIRLGETYARDACQQCHVFTEPSLLDKKSWQNYVLPKMMLYMGLSSLEQVRVEDPDLVRASGILPPEPRIPRDWWGPIVTYYLYSAPEEALPQASKPEVKVGMKQFKIEPPRYRHNPPLTTLVHIDQEARRVYTADAQTQALEILNADGVPQQSIDLGNIPVALKQTARGLYLACIGHFFPSERKQGQVLLLEKTLQGYRRKVILNDLPRVSDIEFADFNGDGRMDFVLSMFGYLTGGLSWFENLGEDRYREHMLFPKAGPMQTIVRDFNQDGTPDIAVLLGQEHDGVYMFYNDKDGKGQFTPHEILRKPPCWGPDYFEPVDFNNDGRLDLLIANGDGADYPQPPKNYHGIRLYLNQGAERFEEVFFYPLHGAFKAVARDFDADGDLDIAAIAFFPDYEKRPMESFVYLENQGGMTFSASTFPQSNSGRWLTLDAGDVDGDGDLDLVLGSLTEMPGSRVPAKLKELWQQRGPSVLILKNTLH